MFAYLKGFEIVIMAALIQIAYHINDKRSRKKISIPSPEESILLYQAESPLCNMSIRTHAHSNLFPFPNSITIWTLARVRRVRPSFISYLERLFRLAPPKAFACLFVCFCVRVDNIAKIGLI